MWHVLGTRDACRILVPKSEELLGRPRRRWDGNIKKYLNETGWGMDWIHLAQDREKWRALVNTVMKFRVPYYSGNYLTR